jgi:acyl-CoA synthetase (AMP-forming)/AMP-acid ligase II
MTLAQADAASDALAARVEACGVGAGDRVAIFVPNGIWWPIAWFALAKLGAVAVPLNPKGGPHDMGHVIASSGAGVAVVDPGLEQPEPLRRLAAVAVGVDSAPARAAATELDGVERSALMNIQYTSGTTGLPKGVMLSHDYWLRLGAIAAAFARLTPDDVVVTVQPFHYLDPQWATIMCLAAGAELVIEPAFSASRFWRSVIDHRATFAYLIGTMPQLLFKQPPDPALDRGHRLRLVACSGIPPQMHAAFEERWGVRFREAYGMTETGVDLLIELGDEASVGSGAVGRPVAGKQVRVVDEDGRPLPDGVVGELVVRGRPRMEGYWGDPAATARAIRDGWLHTGDLAVRDETGAFRLVGRIKDMIRRGGENIAAAEVEHVLCEHPSVRAAAVLAVPDELRGEEVLAFLQPVERPVAEREILAHVTSRLAPFKAPRYLRWVDEFPLTPSERIAKHLLVDPDEDPLQGAWDALG